MSAAAAPTVPAGAPAPAKKGKKKLIIIAAAASLLLAIAGAGAVFVIKKKAHAEENGDEAVAAETAHAAKPDLKHPPTFLPLDPFVVNLADKEVDRYAQVGITFEVEDAKFAESMKAFMPAIRNSILMILSHKGARDLLDRSGKEQLANEILRESARTMGIEIDESTAIEDAPKAKDDAPDGDDEKPKAKAKKKPHKPADPNPIKRVHFSNFIVQ